jgi:hypothetical protein
MVALPLRLSPQEPGSHAAVAAAAELPEAPRPQFELAAAEPTGQQTSAGQGQQPAPDSAPAQNPAAQSSSSQGSSSSQATDQQPGGEKSQHDKAEEQMKEEEKQRVVGVLPTFNVSYRADAVSLSAGQKIRLALHSAVDPFTFAEGFLAAGYHEANDDDTGFGWGIKGYGKRSGAAYLDAADGAMIGNGFLPALLHQDPRYFRLGHGTITDRLLYSLATNVVCKHDNTNRWEPNYSNVAGNIISGAISNLYYPSSNSGVSQTFSNGFIVTAEGGFGSIFEEFWPDISRRFLHKDPTHGLDALARAQDVAEKAARQKQDKKQKQDEKQK